MDGTTEPLIAVIANPIAGNPTQFSLERALAAMQLDWRVISFNIQPDDVGTALEGFAVTGIVGVFIDTTLAAAAADWDAEKTDGEGRIFDCLFRNEQQEFECSNERQVWIESQAELAEERHRLWLGSPLKRNDIDCQGATLLSSRPEPGQIESAKFVLITDGSGGPVELEAADWPVDDGTTTVLDLTSGHPEQPVIRELGYRMLTLTDLQIGRLRQCLSRWTQRSPSVEVIHDAIEEYFSV